MSRFSKRFASTQKAVKPRKSYGIEYTQTTKKRRLNNDDLSILMKANEYTRPIELYNNITRLQREQKQKKREKKRLTQHWYDNSKNYDSTFHDDIIDDSSELYSITQNNNNNNSEYIFDNISSYEHENYDDWLNNPSHISQVNEFINENKWENIIETKHYDNNLDNNSNGSSMKLGRYVPFRKYMRLKRKYKRNNELVNTYDNDNRLISYKGMATSMEYWKENETFDLSLKVWDNIQKKYTHKPVNQKRWIRRLRMKEKQSWRRRNPITDITELQIPSIPQQYMSLPYIELDKIEQMKKVLKLPFREAMKVGYHAQLYTMSDNMRQSIKDLLYVKRWPGGFGERPDEMLFGERLFNSIPIEYDTNNVLKYIANEMPLSLSVNYKILKELKVRMPGFKPKCMIDFGMGSGAATLAAIDIFGQNDDDREHINKNDKSDRVGSLRKIFGIEPNKHFREYADVILKQYKSQHHIRVVNNLEYKITNSQPLVISSFVLSEIPMEKLDNVLDTLWRCTSKVLILIEGGTHDGFNIINYARNYILNTYPSNNNNNKFGSYTISPCPHDKQCPLSDDLYCRFISRIDRHNLPKQTFYKPNRDRINHYKNHKKNKIKSHEVNFPYSYVIIGKGLSPRNMEFNGIKLEKYVNLFPHYFMDTAQSELASYFWPRIITPPNRKEKGMVSLSLCLPNRPAHADYEYKTKENSQKFNFDYDFFEDLNEQILLESHEDSDSNSDSQLNGIMKISNNETRPLFGGLNAKNNEWHPDNDPTHLIKTGLVGEHAIKLKNKKKHPHFKNIKTNDKNISNINEYGYIEKWIITRSDNMLQMYTDARRAKWGDLWPYPSPNIWRYPSVRRNPNSNKYHFRLFEYYRPKFREIFARFTRILGANHFKKNNIHGVVHETKH